MYYHNPSGCNETFLSSRKQLPKETIRNLNGQAIHIEQAPRERIRFLEPYLEFVLRILRHPEALVTDESRLSDFNSFDSDEAKRRGSKPGYYIFEQRIFKERGHAAFIAGRNNPENWEIREFECKAIPWRRMTIRKILRHTGVDITCVFDKDMPVMLQYLADNMSGESRQRVFKRFGITPG